MMLGKFCHGFLDDLPQVALPVHVVRTGRRILELKWTILVLEVLLYRLEEHQRIT